MNKYEQPWFNTRIMRSFKNLISQLYQNDIIVILASVSFTLTFPYSLSELFWLQYVWAFSLAFRLCSSLYGAFIDFLITFCSLPLLTELYDFLNTTRKGKAAVC